jgi:hypothetical protein
VLSECCFNDARIVRRHVSETAGRTGDRFEALSLVEVVMMTPILSTEAFAALGAPNLVYVRPVSGAEILASVPMAQAQGFELSPEQTLYAVHRADGERLAVMTDRDSAVAAALAHELAPVSVH